MAHPEIYANRDGTESISTMWVEDKRLLCRRLDAKHRWKDLASHQDLRLTQDDVLLLSQASPRESPSEGLFNRMAEKRTNMLELYEYLHQADLLAVMNIVQKYIPPHYHVSSETDMLHDPLGEGNSLAPPVPAPPPPLSPLPAANQSPMSLLAPQDFHQAGLHNSLPGLSLDDSGHSIQQELDSMQIRAAHTIMATRNFDIADILKATNDFDEQYMIAKGAYSSVYKVNLMNTDFAAKVYYFYIVFGIVYYIVCRFGLQLCKI
ncbi:hypothetical protein EB796_001896 [Bugula neritina]|uniref:Uncharacterized protein n=1 Tax=Bugula neritina TaxID=10212 RepID=A0A7J7KNY4_BUGNE|nr:hypothetical protein EB796_001896 [Bugula neritina]